MYVGYHQTPAGAPSPCGKLSGWISQFVDILTVGNFDVDIET
jgi:hypothetical protein